MSRDFDTALDSLDRDGRLLSLMEKLNRSHAAEIESLHAELAEIRDGMVALSNRIEAVSRAQVAVRAGDTTPRQSVRPLIHSVPAMPHHPRPS